MDDINALTAELETLTSESDALWAVATDETLSMQVRDAAAGMAAGLDWDAGRVAGALMRARRAAAA